MGRGEWIGAVEGALRGVKVWQRWSSTPPRSRPFPSTSFSFSSLVFPFVATVIAAVIDDHGDHADDDGDGDGHTVVEGMPPSERQATRLAGTGSGSTAIFAAPTREIAGAAPFPPPPNPNSLPRNKTPELDKHFILFVL